ncbi:MAG: DUF2157 domain-containing protein [Pseudomonadota bacterium]
MISKEEATAQIVTLARTHSITLEELASALGRQEIDANKKDAFTLTQVFSYLGGIFILAGLSTYIGLAWSHLNTAARIVVTLGPGIVCLILAIVSAMQQRREKNVTVLVVLSAIFQTIGLFTTAHEFSTGGGDVRVAMLAIFGILGFQYGLLFFKYTRTSLLFFAIYFGLAAFVNLCDLVHIPRRLTEVIFGASVLALSYGIQRTPYNSICGFGYFVGSITLLWTAFDLLKNTPFEILYLGIACFMLYVSTIVRSRSILITSTIVIFSYISYFTSQHFVDSMGWPICLILLGCVFFGISNFALKLNKHFKSADIADY